MSRLADFIAPVADETLLARVICDLLGERDAAQLAALLAEIECLQLKRGDVLIRAGRGRRSPVRRDLRPAAHRGPRCRGHRDGRRRDRPRRHRGREEPAHRRRALGHRLRPARQRGRGDHAVPLREPEAPVSGGDDAPGPHRVAPRAAPRGHAWRLPRRRRRGLCRAAGRRPPRRRAACGLCGAAGVGACGPWYDLTPQQRSPGGTPRQAGHRPGGRRGSLRAHARRLAAAAGAKPLLRDLRGRRCLDAVDAALPAHGRPGAAGGPGRVCPGAHRTGRASGRPQRFHHDRARAAPAGSHLPALRHGGLAGPLPGSRPPSRPVGPAGRF